MRNKIKKIKKSYRDSSTALAVVVMTLATCIGLVNGPNALDKRVVLGQSSSLTTALNEVQGNNPLRREREESGPHYISYAESQRTPGRSGRR